VENAGKQVLGKRFVGVDVPASRRSKRSHCRSVLRHVIGWEIRFGNEMEEGLLGAQVFLKIVLRGSRC
jgi:hypothetical protein